MKSFLSSLAVMTLSLSATQSLATSVAPTINALPDEGEVVLNGRVKAVEAPDRFILQDATGAIDVHVTSGQLLILSEGTPLTVFGEVDDGIFSKNIDATRIVIDKDTLARDELAQAAANASNDASAETGGEGDENEELPIAQPVEE